ncbi:MAG: helix-turn-helix transcriptional regulator [Myxococcota bacterium]
MGETMKRGRPSGIALDAERLRAARIRRGFTQVDLGEIANVTSRTVQSAERGLRVSSAVARDLARALRVPLAAIARLEPSVVHDALAEAGYAPLPAAPAAREDAALAPLVDGCAHGGVHWLVGPDGHRHTQVARSVTARLAERFPDGIVWVSPRLGVNPAAQQLDIARALSFDDRLPARERVPHEAFTRAFRMSFWARTRLLVIDGALWPTILDDFIGPPHAHPVHALVTTTRGDLARAHETSGHGLAAPVCELHALAPAS